MNITEIKEIQTPPTPIEVAELTEAVGLALTSRYAMILRRLVFDWERLKEMSFRHLIKNQELKEDNELYADDNWLVNVGFLQNGHRWIIGKPYELQLVIYTYPVQDRYAELWEYDKSVSIGCKRTRGEVIELCRAVGIKLNE